MQVHHDFEDLPVLFERAADLRRHVFSSAGEFAPEQVLPLVVGQILQDSGMACLGSRVLEKVVALSILARHLRVHQQVGRGPRTAFVVVVMVADADRHRAEHGRLSS
jgi:hypothetical protein